ncbi:hypothetical protein QQP08_013944 [Theobroma cacao]|nr:hypothetical protein QQP08_013944 [Theobroma cacao]
MEDKLMGLHQPWRILIYVKQKPKKKGDVPCGQESTHKSQKESFANHCSSKPTLSASVRLSAFGLSSTAWTSDFRTGTIGKFAKGRLCNIPCYIISSDSSSIYLALALTGESSRQRWKICKRPTAIIKRHILRIGIVLENACSQSGVPEILDTNVF